MIRKILFSGIIIITFCFQISFAQNAGKDPDKLAWRLSAQAWTFNRYTFTEALDKIKSAGINYVEMYSDQVIGGGLTGNTNFLMNKETRGKLLALIQSKGIKLVSYGVVTAKDQDEWVKLFEFAKIMGIETIISEPDSIQLNFIEPLCEKFQIKVALHNHPDPAVYGHTSMYWNPDFTMNQISKRNKYIGVCADLGHWTRSGLNPLESLKKYEGHVFDVHAKDIVPGKDGFCGFHDVPWGTGISNFSGLMHELKRQNYNGFITLEYEYHWESSLPEVKESVDYFNHLINCMNKEN